MIERALAVLPDRCREIFVLSKIEGKKQKEIAEELNVSVKTIESQITIAIKVERRIENSFLYCYSCYLFRKTEKRPNFFRGIILAVRLY
ncbi:MAG: sigma-70 family RNA polymerase sigma factor [Parabacteroides merdae]